MLQPDGGGLIAPSADVKSPYKLLTMITCYPFRYIGSAPKRFIVEAKLVSTAASDKLPGTEAQNTGPPLPLPKVRKPVKVKSIRQASVTQPRPERGLSRLRTPPAASQSVPTQAVKKRRFWRRLLHV